MKASMTSTTCHFPIIRRSACMAALLAVCATGVFAQATAWPEKPVRLVVPYSAGGTTDYAARQIAQKLSDATGKSFFVENIFLKFVNGCDHVHSHHILDCLQRSLALD